MIFSVIYPFFYVSPHNGLAKSVIHFFLKLEEDKVQTNKNSLPSLSFPIRQNVKEVYY